MIFCLHFIGSNFLRNKKTLDDFRGISSTGEGDYSAGGIQINGLL